MVELSELGRGPFAASPCHEVESAGMWVRPDFVLMHPDTTVTEIATNAAKRQVRICVHGLLQGVEEVTFIWIFFLRMSP